VALLERLQKDPALARYAGWFIPLKLETKGEEWSKWTSRYRHEGNAIPILFVVRADGQQLFGKSGTLPGPQLPLMLEQTISQAGKIYGDEQLQMLGAILDRTEQAVAAGDTSLAVLELAKIAKLGSPGELGSYAEVALEVDRVAQQLTEEGRQSLAKAKELLGNEETRLDGALALMETRRVYLPLPALRPEIITAISEYRGQNEFREILKQAEELDEARGLWDKPAGRARALATLRRFIAANPDTPASEIASRWIREQFPDETVSTTDTGSSTEEPKTFHPWTSDSGHKLEASLVGFGYEEPTNAPYVVLQSRDGKRVNVPFARLSKASQDLAKELVRQMREAEAKEKQ